MVEALLSGGGEVKPCIASLHCLFSYDNKLGGSVHAAVNVCRHLAASGQPVEMVAPYGPSDDVRYLAADQPALPFHKVARSFPQRFSNSSELGHWLDQNIRRFQVVEIHGIWVLATWQAARACIRHGVPYFVRPHGSLDPFDLQKRARLKQCLGPVYVRWLLGNAAGVICTAQLEAERLVTYGAKPLKCAMPLPVTLSAQIGRREFFRDKHRIPRDAQVVLFLSRVDYKKGLNFLIPALAKLKQEFPRVWFVLAGVGTPEFTTQVHGWLKKTSVLAFTSEVGFVSGQEKSDAFAAADLFALPSLNENFGIVNVEAMHAGIPLLISDQVYICSEIEEAGAGIICQPCETSVLKKLRHMLGESVDLALMGKQGKQLVEKRYRPEAATNVLIDLYSRTVEIKKHNTES